MEKFLNAPIRKQINIRLHQQNKKAIRLKNMFKVLREAVINALINYHKER